MIITLPWLAHELSSNSRKHWREQAKIIAEMRKHAEIMAYIQVTPSIRAQAGCMESIPVKITFYPPDKRKRDKHNMPANKSVKSYIDGIADALKVDDHKFDVSFHHGEIRKGGEVEVEVLS